MYMYINLDEILCAFSLLSLSSLYNLSFSLIFLFYQSHLIAQCTNMNVKLKYARYIRTFLLPRFDQDIFDCSL